MITATRTGLTTTKETMDVGFELVHDVVPFQEGLFGSDVYIITSLEKTNRPK